MSDLAGMQLGQYQIVEQIAKGGMATVYLAHQSSMKRDVALKFLPQSIHDDDTFLERFYREVEIIAQLQHPHILPVYDFGEYAGQPYIVMAYLNGGTLGDRMTGGTLSLTEIGRIVQQIADALDFAHSKGIIHRDFKPGNVLMDERGNAYLADFGLSKLAEGDKNITGTSILGTPNYMAPEQAQGLDVTSSVDIYALGVTIYQMLTGVTPFDAPTLAGVLVAHITSPVPIIHDQRPDLPADVQQVIERSLAKNSDERYPSSGELAQELVAALQGKLSQLSETEPEPEPEEELTGLMMTNMLGHVIFADNQSFLMLKVHHSEARNIIGKPIQDVLGLEAALADRLIQTINVEGEVSDWAIEIKDSRGKFYPVMCSALATRDDEGTFVGADIRLRMLPKAQDAPSSEGFESIQAVMNTQEKTYLQSYFITQIEALYDLMLNWAGKKVALYLEEIINETGRRNVWPVSMKKGRMTIELRQTDADMYRALLARGMVYTASIIGKEQVIKEMEYVNKNIEPEILSYVSALGLDQSYKDLLS